LIINEKEKKKKWSSSPEIRNVDVQICRIGPLDKNDWGMAIAIAISDSAYTVTARLFKNGGGPQIIHHQS